MDNYKGITKKDIEDLFHYHSDGYLIWKKSGIPSYSRWNARFSNKRAGYIDSSGYRRISSSLTGKQILYCEHRLVYLLHNGFVPEMLDHINRDKCDNRIENLREADKSTNSANTGKNKTNTSGYKGVSFCNDSQRKKAWLAGICVHGKKYYLGHFYTAIEAAHAYNEAALKHHGEFALLNAAELT